MTNSKSLLLATATMLAFAGTVTAAPASGPEHAIKLAQAAQPPQAKADRDDDKKDKEKLKKDEHKSPQRQAQPAAKESPHPEPKAAEKPSKHEQPKAAEKPPQPKHEPSRAAEKPPQPKATEKEAPPKPEQPKAAEKSPQPKHEPSKAAEKPPQPKAAEKAAPPKSEQPKAAEKGPQQPQPESAEKRAQPAAPKSATKPGQSTQPKSAEKPPEPQQGQPKAGQQPVQQAQPAARTATPPPPQQARSADEFIRRKGEAPARSLEDLHKERRETREGNRVIVHEGDRTIVREDNRIIIRHNEAQRFAVGARNVRVEHRGDRTETVIERPNGVRIITVTDADGHLIRRVRRDPNGHEVVIVDESFAGPRRDVFVDLPPPTIRIPRDRYVVELDRAPPQRIYDVLMEPPVDRIEHRYTIAQIRYNAPLRDRMPRVDLDIHFDTGSWQLTPDQVDKLSVIAQQLNRVIEHNERELFLIEGHTDAVGSAEDNLSLSDRRAEAVAVALTEQFKVPPENLVTQGYGEQELKVQTQGSERANRRVAVRRITPLVARAENEGRR